MDQQFRDRLKDVMEEARKTEKIDRERAEQFEGLLKHPGWPVYWTLLNDRIQGLSELVMEPAGSLNGAIGQEYVKGTMRGLILARDLPQLTIAAMEAAKPASGEEK